MKPSMGFQFFTRMVVTSFAATIFISATFAQPLTTYVSALNAARESKWETALSFLKQIPSPGTTENYLTAVCWSRIGNATETKLYLEKALNGTPQLEKTLVIPAANLLQWAEDELAVENIPISYKSENNYTFSVPDKASKDLMQQTARNQAEKQNESEIFKASKDANPSDLINSAAMTNGVGTERVRELLTTQNNLGVPNRPTLPPLVLPNGH